MKKVTDLIEKSQVYYTFEYFPPKTTDGLANLHARLERMAQLHPSCIHLTWGPSGSTAQASIQLAHLVQSNLNIPACLHLTCTNLSLELIRQALDQAKTLGIVNILALRGDPPRGSEYDFNSSHTHFHHAIDLVRYIHQHYPHTFCVGVAGYPEGSPDHSQDQELQFLKEKVDAGAHFIVSQLFYDFGVFLSWHTACRRIGIRVPIIASVMPIQSFDSFRRLTSLCNTSVPQDILDALQPIRADDQAVKEYGIQLALRTIRSLLEHNICAFHLCTLNLERSITRIVDALAWRPLLSLPVPGLIGAGPPPVWDDFPNGRFGDARSPAFGNLDSYGNPLNCSPHHALHLWGSPTSLAELDALFEAYARGTVRSTPWSDTPLSSESSPIAHYIARLNARSFWTVSSQPAVDGAPSTDASVGFGPPGGYVYQKAFVEFFASEDALNRLMEAIDAENARQPGGVGMLRYYAASRFSAVRTNVGPGETNAVTWGVFKEAEVATSTIIESTSFSSWKEEAFEIWNAWELLYPLGSPTRALLHATAEERWLCTVVEHDYKSPMALWDFLDRVSGS